MHYTNVLEPNPHAREATGSLIFTRTMLCLVGMLSVSTVAGAITWSWALNGWAVLVGFIISIGLLFWATSLTKSHDPGAVVPGLLFAAIEGATLGPVLASYTDQLGAQTVQAAVLGTLGLTAVFGLAGTMMQFQYQKVQSVLMVGLFGLILYGVITLFTGIPSVEIDNAYCLLGIIIFCGFFVVDFARLRDEHRHGNDAWGMAMLIAINIYLDMVNVLLYILRLMSNKNSSK